MTASQCGSRGSVLVVDDEPRTANVVRRLLLRDGYDVAVATGGNAALSHIRDGSPDLVLLDVRMADLGGDEVCRHLRRDPATRLLPVVLMTGFGGREARARAAEVGADDYVPKPIDSRHLLTRTRALVARKRFTDRLDCAEQVICDLALTIEARDPYTQGHCERLARYASTLGIHLGLPEDDVDVLHRGGFLHDVGKIGVPDAVLLKPAALSDEERTVMQRHVVVGDALCSELNSLRRVRSIVRHHHERLDGSGYPDGLRGDSIPLLAQIISIVDIYDALTTDRPYRRAESTGEACAELRAEVARGWRRADLVGAFTTLVERHKGFRRWRPVGAPSPAQT